MPRVQVAREVQRACLAPLERPHCISDSALTRLACDCHFPLAHLWVPRFFSSEFATFIDTPKQVSP